MSLLTRLIPSNLLEEKAKFMADQTYNPQFKYESSFTEDELYKYGQPQPKYLELAEEILAKAYHNQTETDLLRSEGPLLSQSEVTHKTALFLQMHGIKNRFTISWSASYVSRATINKDTLKLRTTAEFRREGLLGMLYHEIGTHALRRLNYEQQPWYLQKKKYGFQEYLYTEEGLASLHSLLPHTNKSAYSTAIRYAAVNYAQQHSFSQLWSFLSKYLDDPETRWMVTMRQKRGLTDTSQPGGFTKDLVYFEGMVDTWKWLKAHNFDPTLLYMGKIAAADAQRAQQLNPNFQPLLPSFFVLDPSKYHAALVKIEEENNFSHVKS